MIIPLEKIIAYKGNKYELASAMIDLARKGKGLLAKEAILNNGKFVSVTIKNVIEGKIKYAYDAEGKEIAVEAPFQHSDEIYDNSLFYVEEEEQEHDEDEELEGDEAEAVLEIDDHDDDEAEAVIADEADAEVEEDDDTEEEVESTSAKKKAGKKTTKKASKKSTKKSTKKTTKKKST